MRYSKLDVPLASGLPPLKSQDSLALWRPLACRDVDHLCFLLKLPQRGNRATNCATAYKVVLMFAFRMPNRATCSSGIMTIVDLEKQHATRLTRNQLLKPQATADH
jgi:hypothetical protein